MRGIVYALGAWGHMNPTLGLIRELAASGDEITCVSSSEFRGPVESAGCRFFEQQPRVLSEPGQVVRNRGVELRLARRIAEATTEVLTTSSHRLLSPAGFDYVVHDSLAPWGKFLAKREGVPAVALVTMFASTERMILGYVQMARQWAGASVGPRTVTALYDLPQVRRMMEATAPYGGKPADLFSAYGDLNVLCTSRDFQPFAELLDDRWFVAGPVLDGWAPDGEPDLGLDPSLSLVIVSMGTSFQRRSTFLTIARALARFDGQVLLVTGGADLNLPPLPSNFMVRRWMPDRAAFARARVYITHGGIGSLSKAFQQGVPAVIVAQAGDQSFVGARAEQLGAAVHIPWNHLTAKRLRDAFERVLGDPRYKERAAWLGATFEASAGMRAAATAIRDFARRRATAASMQSGG